MKPVSFIRLASCVGGLIAAQPAAVHGQVSVTTYHSLYAFAYPIAATGSAGTFKLLYSKSAGPWPFSGHNANVVPVVANGKVYVASYRTLTIFGDPATAAPAAPIVPETSPVASPSSPHYVVTGTLLEVSGSTLSLQTRGAKTVKIDYSQAARNEQMMGPLTVGKLFTVEASTLTSTGALVATSIVRAKSSSSSLWPPDH